MADIRPYRFTDAEIDEWCVAPHGFVWAAGHDHNSWCLAHEVRESRIEIERLREQFGRQEAFWAEENDALRDEIKRLRAQNAALRFRLADLHRRIDHDPATCALLACDRCDAWEARRG